MRPPEQLQLVTARPAPDGSILASLTIDGNQVLVTLRPSVAAQAVAVFAGALAGVAKGYAEEAPPRPG